MRHCSSHSVEKDFHQAGDRECRRGLFAFGKTERQRRLRRKFTHQCDRSGPGGIVLRGHAAKTFEVLPTVARLGAAGGTSLPCIGAVRIGGGQRQCKRSLLRPQNLAAVMRRRPSAVVFRFSAKPRRQQGIGFQLRSAIEPILKDECVANLGWTDAQHEGEARVMIDNLHRGYAGKWRLDLVAPEAAQFDPEVAVVCDDKAEILDLGNVDAWVVDFRDDAFRDREPDSRRAQARAHHILARGCPSRTGGRCGRCFHRHGLQR